MAEPTDVLIVGAGPAGGVAALVLARAGLRVRVLDRATFPRDKLCGDTINPGSLAILRGLGLEADVRAAAVPVAGMLVSGPGGVHVSADYPAGIAGAAMTRRHFDQQVIAAAVAAGAVFDDGVRVTAAALTGDGVAAGVVVQGRDGPHRLTARLIIAADGRASRLGAQLGLATFAPSPRRWAFGAYFDGVDGLTRRGEMHVRDWGYLGIAPLAGGVANVCVVARLTHVRRQRRDGAAGGDAASLPREVAARVIGDTVRAEPELRERFARARQVSAVSVLGPLAVDARASGCPGLLLAGDAAGFVDPMTGDGLRFALQGGLLAADHARRELESGAAQHAALHRARHQAFAAKWRVNRALRALVGWPPGVRLAGQLAAHWDTPVRALIGIAGDVGLSVDDGPWRPGSHVRSA